MCQHVIPAKRSAARESGSNMIDHLDSRSLAARSSGMTLLIFAAIYGQTIG